MNIIRDIKDLVEAECKKPTSKYGDEVFEFHFIPVVEYAKQLTDELGGDKEVIIIATWLHDIGSIIHGKKDHHITGVKIAEAKLKELKYPEDKIELVKKCILNHRSSQENIRQSLEEKIVAEADAMSCFDMIPGLFKAAYIYENKNQGEAKRAIREKLQRKWKKLHFSNSRKILRAKYKAAMLLFG